MRSFKRVTRTCHSPLSTRRAFPSRTLPWLRNCLGEGRIGIAGRESGSQHTLPVADDALEFGLAAMNEARTHVKRKLEHLVKAFNTAHVISR